MNARLFANNNETPVMSLYDDSAAKRYGTASYINYPDNVTQANQAFNTYDLYHNKVETTITDGCLVLGLYKYEWIDSDWCCFDNFTLTYLGIDTSVNAMDNGKWIMDNDQVYDLQGRRVNHPLSILSSQLSKGIYINSGKKITIK